MRPTCVSVFFAWTALHFCRVGNTAAALDTRGTGNLSIITILEYKERNTFRVGQQEFAISLAMDQQYIAA